jgi:cell division protein FtsN
MAQKLIKRIWKFILVIILITCGMITSTGEYAFAQTASTSTICIPSPTNLCRPISQIPNPTPTPDKPHVQAVKHHDQDSSPALLRRIKQLQKDDPHKLEKLRQGDAAS